MGQQMPPVIWLMLNCTQPERVQCLQQHLSTVVRMPDPQGLLQLTERRRWPLEPTISGWYMMWLLLLLWVMSLMQNAVEQQLMEILNPLQHRHHQVIVLFPIHTLFLMNLMCLRVAEHFTTQETALEITLIMSCIPRHFIAPLPDLHSSLCSIALTQNPVTIT